MTECDYCDLSEHCIGCSPITGKCSVCDDGYLLRVALDACSRPPYNATLCLQFGNLTLAQLQASFEELKAELAGALGVPVSYLEFLPTTTSLAGVKVCLTVYSLNPNIQVIVNDLIQSITNGTQTRPLLEQAHYVTVINPGGNTVIVASGNSMIMIILIIIIVALAVALCTTIVVFAAWRKRNIKRMRVGDASLPAPPESTEAPSGNKVCPEPPKAVELAPMAAILDTSLDQPIAPADAPENEAGAGLLDTALDEPIAPSENTPGQFSPPASPASSLETPPKQAEPEDAQVSQPSTGDNGAAPTTVISGAAQPQQSRPNSAAPGQPLLASSPKNSTSPAPFDDLTSGLSSPASALTQEPVAPPPEVSKSPVLSPLGKESHLTEESKPVDLANSDMEDAIEMASFNPATTQSTEKAPEPKTPEEKPVLEEKPAQEEKPAEEKVEETKKLSPKQERDLTLPPVIHSGVPDLVDPSKDDDEEEEEKEKVIEEEKEEEHKVALPMKEAPELVIPPVIHASVPDVIVPRTPRDEEEEKKMEEEEPKLELTGGAASGSTSSLPKERSGLNISSNDEEDLAASGDQSFMGLIKSTKSRRRGSKTVVIADEKEAEGSEDQDLPHKLPVFKSSPSPSSSTSSLPGAGDSTEKTHKLKRTTTKIADRTDIFAEAEEQEAVQRETIETARSHPRAFNTSSPRFPGEEKEAASLGSLKGQAHQLKRGDTMMSPGRLLAGAHPKEKAELDDAATFLPARLRLDHKTKTKHIPGYAAPQGLNETPDQVKLALGIQPKAKKSGAKGGDKSLHSWQ